MSPFDYINNISTSRTSIWDENTSESDYTPYIINRGLSMFYDTVLYSQEMNRYSEFISKKMQYDFYRLGVKTKMKRFAKWHKTEKLANVELLAKHFNINNRTMENYLSLISDDDLATLLNTLNTGGRNAK